MGSRGGPPLPRLFISISSSSSPLPPGRTFYFLLLVPLAHLTFIKKYGIIKKIPFLKDAPLPLKILHTGLAPHFLSSSIGPSLVLGKYSPGAHSLLPQKKSPMVQIVVSSAFHACARAAPILRPWRYRVLFFESPHILQHLIAQFIQHLRYLFNPNLPRKNFF